MKTSKLHKILAGTVCSLMLVLSCQAQAPQAFNYQAIVRNTNGTPMTSSSVVVRATIHNDSAKGTVLYQEIFTPTTNQFGLINLQIGTGAVVTGIFSNIPWGVGTKWMQIEANFGSGYVPMGTSQLLSVPYALNATPTGIIAMWSGLLANIPAGWALCDGTNGTPDLRDRFIYGVKSGENPGVTGGDSTVALGIPANYITSGASSLSLLGDASAGFYYYSSPAWWNPAGGTRTTAPTDYYGTPATTTTPITSLPPYYKLAFIMKQ